MDVTVMEVDSAPAEAPSGEGAARALFSEHQAEIQRRANVARSGTAGSSSFERAQGPGSGDDPPFRLPSQRWVLFSLSHVAMPPVAANPALPALRVYGCYEHREDALSHASCIAAEDAACCLMVSQTHEWVVAAKCAARATDAALCAAKVERLLRRYALSIEERRAEFEANRQQKLSTAGEAAAAVPRLEDEIAKGCERGGLDEEEADPDAPPEIGLAARAEAPHDELAPHLLGKRRCTGYVSRAAEVSGQSFMCASFVQDSEEPGEPEFLFRVYACFGTEAEADAYVRNVAANEVTDHDIDVVSLCQWIFPTDPNLNVRVEYRSAELTRIMENNRKQPADVKRYTQWLESSAPAAAPST